MRRVIFFFKLVDDFRLLAHDLMVKLLKHSMMCLLQVNGAQSYNPHDNTFKEPNTDDTPFSAESLEVVYGSQIYAKSIAITRSLNSLCGDDDTRYVHIKLLLLVVLFDPLNEALSEDERKTVRNLQDKYVSLLYAYLSETFGSPHAEITFKTAIYEIRRAKELAYCFQRAVQDGTSQESVRPLMREVLCIEQPLSTSSLSSSNESLDSVLSMVPS